MNRRLLLVGLFCVSGFVFADADLDGPPDINFRGTWTETREDMPGVILVHRNGHTMEVMRVPGTGEGGIPLQLVGPSEISMKWAGAPMPWPPGVTVLAEEPQYGDVIRIHVAEDAAVAAGELMAMPEVMFAYPVEFTDPMFARILKTDQIIARLAADVTIDQIEAPFGLMMVEPMLGSTVEFVLQLMDPKAMPPDLVVSNLTVSGLVEWAQVNCIRDAEFYYTPTDPQFGNQWHLNATGQAIVPGFTAPTNVDVDAPAAWNTTRGGPSIRVAVIDDAIETNHVDLAGNIYAPGAYDFFNNDFDPSPDTANDMHGTPCAGVVGAVEGNALGVAGTAHQSPIVPIKICSNGVLPNDAQVANSVRHGADHADIITCSWGYVNPAPSTLSSVRYALQSGAGGRGSVVFFAAGNDGGFIPHMATLGAAGTYTLRWRYTKDGSISSGLDKCFLDTVWYPDGTQDMFDGLTVPNLPGYMTPGGTGNWFSQAQSAGNRAESGTGAAWQFLESPTITHSQSSYVDVTQAVAAPNTPMWYYMRVDAQPTTYVGNNATMYDFGQLEYQRNGGVWTNVNVQGGAPQTLSYPANDPETIAVGANDVTGRRSHYSQFAGGALDFVAPSDGPWAALGIETTDLMGAPGYSSGNYCLAGYGSKFGGTSSATPLAAGIGALVRSVNSSLSPSQVRNVLRASCRKIDPTWYTYNGILGGRDQYVGWGQVDASNAVTIAQNTLPIPVMAVDLKITEVSPMDMNGSFVEIYNSSAINAYQLDTVMLTDCATGGDQSESSYQFTMGSVIPPQGTIVVALGAASVPLRDELQALVGAGAASAGGLQLFECQSSGLMFMGGPIGQLMPPPPLVGTGINLTASDIALVITPGMQASYLPDLIDGMSYGTPIVNGILGSGPMVPDAPLVAGGANPMLSYQRTSAVDTDVSQADFSVQSRTPGWVAFGSPVTSFVAAPLTSSAIDLRIEPFMPGDTVMIAQSPDSIFDYPIHGTPYFPINPLGPGGDMVIYSGPAGPGMPIFDFPLPPSTPMYYRVWTVDPMMQYSVGKDSDSSSLAPPMALPFVDTFTNAFLDTALWPYAPGVSVDTGVLSMPPLPSPPNCAQIDYATSTAPELATTGIDTTTTPNVKLIYFWQEGGMGDPPEPGEILQVEILDPGMMWMPVMQHMAGGGPMPFMPQEVIIDPGMLHSEFRVRFVSIGVSSGPADLDHWFIDDVRIEEYPVLSGFQWGPVPAKVSVDVPLDVFLTALSSMGGTLSNYMDDATLSLFQTNGTPLATLDPTVAVPFIDGVWSNTPLMISAEPTLPVYLTAEFNAMIGTSTVFEVLEDVDEDNMADGWEFQWFGDINVATNTVGSDQDGDNYPDYSEFVAGTIPTDSNSLLDVDVQLGVSNVLSWPSVSNRTYEVDGASNLLSGFSVLTNNLVATPPTNTFSVLAPTNAPTSFYKVKVTK